MANFRFTELGVDVMFRALAQLSEDLRKCDTEEEEAEIAVFKHMAVVEAIFNDPLLVETCEGLDCTEEQSLRTQ